MFLDTLGDSNTVLGNPDLVTMKMAVGEMRSQGGREASHPEPPDT